MLSSRTIGDLTVLAITDAEAAHFDLPAEAFPEATAADWAAAEKIDPGSFTADGRWWLRFWSLLAEPERLDVRDGDASLGAGVRLIATPGHTPGHQCVLVTDGDEELLITGDLFVHAVQLVDPGLAYRHETDPELARVSRTGIVRGGVAGQAWAPSHLGYAFTRTPNDLF